MHSAALDHRHEAVSEEMFRWFQDERQTMPTTIGNTTSTMGTTRKILREKRAKKFKRNLLWQHQFQVYFPRKFSFRRVLGGSSEKA